MTAYEHLKADLAAHTREAVSQDLLVRLPRLIEEAVQSALDPYLTKKQLMALTGWSSRQVEYKKSRRQIPFIRRGRTVLFLRREVYAYLNEGRVSAKPPRSK